MEVFQELKILVTKSEIDDFIRLLERRLAPNWVRDQEKESWIKEGSDGRQFCFFLRDNSRYPSAFVWLVEKTPRVLTVPNIIPAKKSELSRREYNEILTFFFETVVRPVVQTTGDQGELSSATASLEELLGEPAAQKLRYFSATANKGTGGSHPSDFEKWLDFLAELHRDHVQLDNDVLRRWLQEEEKWPEETANELVRQCEFARSLLDFYDESRR